MLNKIHVIYIENKNSISLKKIFYLNNIYLLLY